MCVRRWLNLKYSTSDALNEVLTRRNHVRRKREKRRLAWYCGSVCAILLVLTFTGLWSNAGGGSYGGGGEGQSGAEHMGSFLLEAKTGGILAALILAFILGILAALLFIRRRKVFPKSEESKETPEAVNHPEASQNTENGGHST